MKYTVKEKGDQKIIQGNYIPVGFTCLCKSCKFTIEVPKDTNDQQIKELVDKLNGL